MTHQEILASKTHLKTSFQIGYFAKGMFMANTTANNLFEAIEKRKWADEHYQMKNHIVMATEGVSYVEIV